MIDSIRAKRIRECDTSFECDQSEQEENLLSFANKRICPTPITTRNASSVLNTITYEYPVGCSQRSQKSKEDRVVEEEDAKSNDMDISDDIVSNFNTISFDSSNSQVALHNKQSCSPPSYPVFPPLQRAGRKIDHLVEEVIRKSSRINPELLRISIPSGGRGRGRGIVTDSCDFEFQMPAHVTVGGGPTRDARFLTSPESRRLSEEAMRLVTTSATAPTTATMSSGLHSSAPSEYRTHKDTDLMDTSSADSYSPTGLSSPPPFHLGRVSHTDWFSGSSESHSSNNNSSKSGSGVASGGGSNQSHNGIIDNHNQCNHGCSKAMGESSDEEDEDCDDMYVDSY